MQKDAIFRSNYIEYLPAKLCNSLKLDQAKMSGIIWIHTVWHSTHTPEKFIFLKQFISK